MEKIYKVLGFIFCVVVAIGSKTLTKNIFNNDNSLNSTDIEEKLQQYEHIKIIKENDKVFYDYLVHNFETLLESKASPEALSTFGAESMNNYLSSKKNVMKNLDSDSVNLIFESNLKYLLKIQKYESPLICNQVFVNFDFRNAENLIQYTVEATDITNKILTEIYSGSRVPSSKDVNFSKKYGKKLYDLSKILKNDLNIFMNGDINDPLYCASLVSIYSELLNDNSAEGIALKRFFIFFRYGIE